MRLMTKEKTKKKLTHQECNDLSHHLVLQQSVYCKYYIVAKEMESKKKSCEIMIISCREPFDSQSITDPKISI